MILFSGFCIKKEYFTGSPIVVMAVSSSALMNEELFSGSSLQVKKNTENVRTILLKNLFLATFPKIID